MSAKRDQGRGLGVKMLATTRAFSPARPSEPGHWGRREVQRRAPWACMTGSILLQVGHTRQHNATTGGNTMELTEGELRLVRRGLLAIDREAHYRDKEITALLKRVQDEIMMEEIRADRRRRGYRTWAEWEELKRERSHASVSLEGNR